MHHVQTPAVKNQHMISLSLAIAQAHYLETENENDYNPEPDNMPYKETPEDDTQSDMSEDFLNFYGS